MSLSLVPGGGMKYAEYYAVVQQNLRSWNTSEGVKLGSSEAEIRRAYGIPTREETATSGRTGEPEKKALIYRGRYGAGTAHAFFQIEDGKLTAIVIAKTTYTGPDCLGPFCAENTIKASNSLLQELEDPRPSSRGSLNCYREPSRHAFAQLEQDEGGSGLLLSDFPTCAHASRAVERVTTANIQDWKTPEGIGLGSSKENVMRVYGKPTREDKVSNRFIFRGYESGQVTPDAGDVELFYGSEELTWARFGIRRGRVCYVWLANSE